MSEQQSSAADVTADISDQQVKEFFDSKGNEEVVKQTSEPLSDTKVDKVEDSNLDKEKSDQEDKQFDRNYKIAMQEERERRKEIQRELRDIQLKNERLEQTFQRMMYEAQKPPEPSFDNDPLGSLKYRSEKLEEQLKQQNQIEAQRQQAYQQQMQQQQFIGAYQQKALEYAQNVPDFKEAYSFLDKDKITDYLEAGYTHQEAKQLLIEDEMAIVAKAFQDGVNPAERIYKLALKRGFKASAPTKAINDSKLEQIEKGLQASKSIGNAGGKTDRPLTLEAVAAMDDEEFSKVDWKKLMKMG